MGWKLLQPPIEINRHEKTVFSRRTTGKIAAKARPMATETAYAKINLALHVRRRREDSTFSCELRSA